jgi:hypothetical protein
VATLKRRVVDLEKLKDRAGVAAIKKCYMSGYEQFDELVKNAKAFRPKHEGRRIALELQIVLFPDSQAERGGPGTARNLGRQVVIVRNGKILANTQATCNTLFGSAAPIICLRTPLSILTNDLICVRTWRYLSERPSNSSFQRQEKIRSKN